MVKFQNDFGWPRHPGGHKMQCTRCKALERFAIAIDAAQVKCGGMAQDYHANQPVTDNGVTL